MDRPVARRCLEIAGLRYVLHSKFPGEFEDPPPIPYGRFYAREMCESKNGSDDIRVRFETGDLPQTQSMTKIFESKEFWTLFLQDGDAYISLHSPIFKDPVWVAQIHGNLEKVTVYLSQDGLDSLKVNSKGQIRNPLCYPLDQVLTMYALARRRGILVHAACIAIRGRGYIFPGKSGAGKSTLTRQFQALKNVEPLSDDRVVLRDFHGAWTCHGTPWAGEERVAKNANAPLKGIFFLDQASKNRIQEISTQEAVERLFPVTSIPWYDRETTDKLLLVLEAVAREIPAYRLDFTRTPEVADLLLGHDLHLHEKA